MGQVSKVRAGLQGVESGVPIMPDCFNNFVDFIGDFPYDASWVEDASVDPPGKELVAVLADGLRARGIELRNVEANGHGYIVECEFRYENFAISVTVDEPSEMKRWNVECPYVTWWAKVSSHPYQNAYRHLLKSIHQILTEHVGVRDVRWFPHYDSPENLNDHLADVAPIKRQFR
jgi:hypothetical protein